MYIIEQLRDGLYAALKAFFPDLPEEVMIAIGELMTYICYAVVESRGGASGAAG